MELFERKSRIAPFFWLHGESKEALSEEIEAIYKSGISAVCLESRTHEGFCCDEWFSDVSFILNECRKRGMKLWILDDKHFPTGYANGALKNANFDKRPWGITEAHVDIPGNIEECALIVNHHLTEDDELLKIIACRHKPNTRLLEGETIDLTDKMYDGMVYFSLLEGMWRIFFIKKTRGGLNKQFSSYIDMLNPDSVDLLIKEVYEKHYENLKDEFGKTLLGFFSDEPGFYCNSAFPDSFYLPMGREFSHYPYSDGLMTYCKEKLGVDALSLLPGLWEEFDDGREAKIRYTYMDFVTAEYRRCFTDRIGEWCRAHNVKYIGHVIEDNRIDASLGAGCGHYFRALDGQDMSGIDVVLNQIVPGMKDTDSAGPVCYKHMNYNFFKYMLAKLGSSMAHLDEKKHGDAMCEIFGAYGWVEGTKTMKWLCDHMLVRGINYFVPHAFSAKERDTDCPPIFYFRGENPEYQYFGKIAGYLERAASLLSGGSHKADAIILYDAEAKWMSDKNAFPIENIAKELYENQIDFDIVPTDYLCNAKVNDGKIGINGEEFKVLFVPESRFIDEKTETTLRALKERGARIVFVGNNNEKVPSGFERSAPRMLADVMEKIGKDVKIEKVFGGNTDEIHVLHYIKDEKDIYMITNEGIDESVNFRFYPSSTMGECALYDAMDENTTKSVCSADGGIEITIPPYGSIFVLDGVSGERTEKVTDERAIELNYEISLAECTSEKFEFYRKTSSLFNVTGKDFMPRFSGRMKYEARFVAEEGENVIDLGEVGEIAEVYVNGTKVGEKVCPPYRFSLDEVVEAGENELKIIVTNTNVFSIRDSFSSYMRIEPSGLLGPVKLQKVKKE